MNLDKLEQLAKAVHAAEEHDSSAIELQEALDNLSDAFYPERILAMLDVIRAADNLRVRYTNFPSTFENDDYDAARAKLEEL